MPSNTKTHLIKPFNLDQFSTEEKENLRFLDLIISKRDLVVAQAKSIVADEAPKYFIYDQAGLASVTYEDQAIDSEIFYWVEYSDLWSEYNGHKHYCASTSVETWMSLEELIYRVLPIDDQDYKQMDPRLVRLLAIAPESVIHELVDWAVSMEERFPTSQEALEYLFNK